MIKPIVQGVTTVFSVAAKAGLAILLTLLVYGGMIAAKKELSFMIFSHSNFEGTWLATDGNEKEDGRLELLITQDSVYYGDRVFGDGKTVPFYKSQEKYTSSDKYYRQGAIMNLTADSLVLRYPNGSSQGWRVDLGIKTLDLIGDSYPVHFVKVADEKVLHK